MQLLLPGWNAADMHRIYAVTAPQATLRPWHM